MLLASVASVWRLILSFTYNAVHEFGHVAHFLCGKSRLHRFASFRCEQDFVEAPSQMLENWCWQPSTLQLLSGHYKHAGEKLPLELAEKLQLSRIAHAGTSLLCIGW
jgi:thimet oligopeptidase